MSIPFHTTRMGQTFYEGTMPALVRQLQQLNANLAALKDQGTVPKPTDTHHLAVEAQVAHTAAKYVRGQAYKLACEYDTELARKIWSIPIPGEDAL